MILSIFLLCREFSFKRVCSNGKRNQGNLDNKRIADCRIFS